MEEAFAKLSLGDKDKKTGVKDEKKKESSDKSTTPIEIKILSWNICADMHDDPDQATRMAAIARIINQKQPDVVFLQSLHQKNCDFFRKEHDRKYFMVQENDTKEKDHIVLLRKTSIEKYSHEIVKMPECTGRHDAIKIKTNIKDMPVALIAVHIRSKKENLHVRLRQHDRLYKLMGDEDEAVIGGGTTNTRDYEGSQAPSEITDAWEDAGSPSSEEVTWDMSVNHNRPRRDGRRLYPFRFERLFKKDATDGKKLEVTRFNLVGREKLSCGKFPSDHFGIFVVFKQVE